MDSKGSPRHVELGQLTELERIAPESTSFNSRFVHSVHELRAKKKVTALQIRLDSLQSITRLERPIRGGKLYMRSLIH